MDGTQEPPNIQTTVLFPQNSALFLEGILMTFAVNIITIISDPPWQSSPTIIALDSGLWPSLTAMVHDHQQ